ncbi:MAG TPA: hypothetical protein PLU50_12640, partial [Pseudobdellovibrionaceae bacterium]|nr:hypothetical protein [Pseudobdellovibrionaceae bacterium]
HEWPITVLRSQTSSGINRSERISSVFKLQASGSRFQESHFCFSDVSVFRDGGSAYRLAFGAFGQSRGRWSGACDGCLVLFALNSTV